MLIETPFSKQPWEQITIRFDWAARTQYLVDDGYAYSAVEVKVFDSSGLDKTADMVEGLAVRENNYIRVTIKGGSDPLDYYCRVRVTLTKALFNDQKLEADLLIQVREKGK